MNPKFTRQSKNILTFNVLAKNGLGEEKKKREREAGVLKCVRAQFTTQTPIVI